MSKEAQVQSKKLNQKELKKLESYLNQSNSILVYNNQFQVKIHSHFRDSFIEKVIMDYTSVLDQIYKQGTEIQTDSIRGSFAVFHTLILREFTDLPIPKTNELSILITVSRTLLDTGIMKEIYNAIPTEQLNKIEQKMKSVLANFEQMAERT